MVLCPTVVPDLENTLEKYIEGLPWSIEGDVTSSNPTSLEAAIELAQKLLDREVKCSNELKRKLDDQRTTHSNSNPNSSPKSNSNPNNKNSNPYHHNRNNRHNRKNQKQEAVKAYTATDSKEYQGLKPQ